MMMMMMMMMMMTQVKSLDLHMEVNFRNGREPFVVEVENLKDEALSRKGTSVICDRRGDCTNVERMELMRQIEDIVRSNGKRLWKNHVLEEMMGTRRVRDATGKTFELNSGITAEEGSFLHDMIVQNKITRTLEIGMAYGVSTTYILQGHRAVVGGGDSSTTTTTTTTTSSSSSSSSSSSVSRRHVAVDPNQSTQWKAIGFHNVMKAGLQEFLRLMEEPSYLALPKLVQAKEKFELILIDGMHTFDYTLLDFFYADLLLSINGVMIFDDKQMPAVRKVIDYILKNRSYRLVEPQNLITNSFAVLIKNEEDDRAWDFHAEF